MLAQKGTRVLTNELKDELKRKVEVWVVAEKEKSEHLEKKWQEKVFNEAMLNSPIGLFIQNSLSSTWSFRNY